MFVYAMYLSYILQWSQFYFSFANIYIRILYYLRSSKNARINYDFVRNITYGKLVKIHTVYVCATFSNKIVVGFRFYSFYQKQFETWSGPCFISNWLWNVFMSNTIKFIKPKQKQKPPKEILLLWISDTVIGITIHSKANI